MSDLPATVERCVEVRWQDLDPLGHVGHDVYLAYLEVARNALLAAHGVSMDGYVVASAMVNYRHEIRMGTPRVHGRCGIAQVGRTSLTTAEHLLGPDGTLLADAAFVLVLWDPAARRPRAVTDAERTAFEHAPDGVAR